MKDIQAFHASFYSCKEKVIQDAFILKHCTAQQCKRRRPKDESRGAKKINIKCYVHSTLKKDVPVCQKAFLKILGVTKHRLQFVLKNYSNDGKIPIERRGGDHKFTKYENKRIGIQNFINKLQCVESHYCRSQSNRMYLPSELNVNKLYRMYMAEAAPEVIDVKMSFFRSIFNSTYNLSFKSPRTDVCSKCLEISERLKIEKDLRKKQDLLIEKRVHRLKANAFFQLLRQNRDDLIILSFDCEKNLVLPKVPDQSAYYSRQIYIYNFTIVQGSSKSPLSKKNVFSYYWTENEFKKSSNEIASAVFHRLANTILEQTTKTVRLVADGCSAQNKNSIMISMCSKWLVSHAPAHVTSIELVFPIVGHSFLPADRVFGVIEKKIRRTEVVVKPEEYVEIFKQSATVFHLGQDCKVLDWKNAAESVIKPVGKWHFQFLKCKRFHLKRSAGNVLIKGEVHYKNDLGSFKGFAKKGKSSININPLEIPSGVCVNPLKLNDVHNLLCKHFGDNWMTMDNLSFYKKLICHQQNNEPNSSEEDNGRCEFIADSPDLVV